MRWPGGGSEAPPPAEPPTAPLAAPPPAEPAEPARELKPYATDSLPHVESTYIDRTMEARARAMVSPEQTAVATAPVDAPAVQARPLPLAPALDPPRALQLSDDEELIGAGALPGFGAAMLLRVRFAGGEVPVWSLVAPLIVMGALVAALTAAAVSGAPTASAADEPQSSASAAPVREGSAVASAVPSARSAPASVASAEPPTPGQVEGFDLPAGKYVAKDVLSVAAKRAAREIAAAKQLQSALDRDPGLVEEPRTLVELRRLSDSPETARIVLEAMAALPAPVAADMLYEVWTGTVQRNETTELARALLFSKDVRPKASPALSVALDLRVAQGCPENQAILARAENSGDRRSLHLLVQLQRRYGCGPNKRQDCNPCLRVGDALEVAIKAAKERREPRAFGKR